MLGLQNEREWAAFCTVVLRRPELAADERFSSNSRRVANRAELDPLIRSALGALSAGELGARLDAAQIANARMNDLNDVWRHPQLAARRRWTEVGSPAGPIPALLPPVTSDGFAPRMGAVPALGEHTDAILAELGWSEEAIARLRRDGAV
jgi:itaconate CoA-transferase